MHQSNAPGDEFTLRDCQCKSRRILLRYASSPAKSMNKSECKFQLPNARCFNFLITFVTVRLLGARVEIHPH